ncbi:MAG: glycine--tRNA ligase subunit beta [Alphaproteobacteria bacterium]|nr:MAG: glycine--tRNA ligase subunit beta [Alphaproteobacteria bacterium]
MSDFLFEIFSEEIPARMQQAACQALKDHFENGLAEKNLSFERVETAVTPRRLAISIQGLPATQADEVLERKGPAVNAPQKAIDGFLESVQLSLDQLDQRDLDKKGVFYFAALTQKGQATGEILAALISRFLQSYRWPKSMRWGSSDFSWVRPIHTLVALFDGEILPVPAPHPGVTVGRVSYGHRFMAPDAFEVQTWAQYNQALRDRFVILRAEERAEKIQAGYQEKASDRELVLPETAQAQAKQVAGLVEWPVVCVGHFAKDFLQMPVEVLTTSMWTHQYYTPLYDTQGALSHAFVFTANIDPEAGVDAIIAGNEAVLQARLQDAQFFWRADQKASLDAWNEKLKAQTFHEKLGTVYQRLERFEKMAAQLDDANDALKQACRYAKADLASQMVAEFPELQGVMGGYYLAHHGYDSEVCQAVRQHYQDQGQTDKTAAQLALIERLDTLTSFFAVGIQPTSSKDPYALRRAALGIIRLCVDHGIKMDVERLIQTNYLSVVSDEKIDYAVYSQQLRQFILDRFRYYLKETYAHDVIDATLRSSWFVESLDFARAVQACQVLTAVLKTPQGHNLVMAFDRVDRILGEAQERDPVAEDVFQHSIETALCKVVQALEKTVPDLVKTGQFEAVLGQFEALYDPLNAFFEGVLVNDPDAKIAANRRSLLQLLRSVMQCCFQFGSIEKS